MSEIARDKGDTVRQKDTDGQTDSESASQTDRKKRRSAGEAGANTGALRAMLSLKLHAAM